MMPPRISQVIPVEVRGASAIPMSFIMRTWIANEILFKSVSKLNSEGIWIHLSDVIE